MASSVVLVASVTLSSPALASDPEAFVPVKVSDPRPLAAAADQLQRRYGIVIHYEDPPYSFSGDLVPATTKASSKGLSKGEAANPIMIPAGSGLEMSLAYDPSKSMVLDLGSILQGLVQVHADTDQPGRFRVDQVGGEYCLIPEEVRQGKGALAPVTPVLDTPISGAGTAGTALAALQEIVEQVSKFSEQSVQLGMVPANLLHQTTVSLSSNSLPAREILAELVAALPNAVSWRLLYDANLQAYYLNLEIVRTQTLELLTYEPPPEASVVKPSGKGK